jgi:hypothetical protein
MRESYKRFVKTWIRFVSSVFKRFDSWICFVTQFSKDSFCGFVSWHNFPKIRRIQRILSTIGQTNPDSRILWFSKDSFRGFVLSYGVQTFRFVDSFCKIKNSKLLDSFRKDSYTNPASLAYTHLELLKRHQNSIPSQSRNWGVESCLW